MANIRPKRSTLNDARNGARERSKAVSRGATAPKDVRPASTYGDTGLSVPKAPIVDVRRERWSGCDQLIIDRCPFCRKKHVHGVGGSGLPLGAGDGHRVAHCIEKAPDNPGYILREVETVR